MLVVPNHPLVELNCVVWIVADRVHVANQIVQDVSEQNWEAPMLEELFTHHVEIFEAEAFSVHLVVLVLHEVVKVLVDHLALAPLGVNFTTVDHVEVPLEFLFDCLLFSLNLLLCLLFRNYAAFRLLEHLELLLLFLELELLADVGVEGLLALLGATLHVCYHFLGQVALQ